jgi:hypothetical protein
MTDKEAMKLALDALENQIANVYDTESNAYKKCLPAITALKERLADPMREVQRLGQEIEQEPVAHPERHELQAKGEHPAPCARHCEANAFQIVIKNLKAQLAQPEQEPVALPCCGYTDASAIKWNSFNGVVQCHNCGQTYTPPQRTEQNFCSRCGKRTKDLTHIHTCTPPKENT